METTTIRRMNESMSRSEVSLVGENVGQEKRVDMKEMAADIEVKSKHLIWASLRTILYDAAVNTTMHGLPGIVRSKHILLKIMWAVCLLGSTGVCAYLLIKSVQDYLEYDVVTVTSTVYEVPTLFPVIFELKKLLLRLNNVFFIFIQDHYHL